MLGSLVPGTRAAIIIMPGLAQQLAGLRKQRDEIAAEVDRRVLAHPHWPVLTSMPGVGVTTAARLLTEAAQSIRFGGSPGGLRWPRASYPALRLIYPWRASVQARQQGTQARPVALRLRGFTRPCFAGVLRTQSPAGQEA